MTIRTVARSKRPYRDPQKKGNRLFVMSIGTRAERFASSKYQDEGCGHYWAAFSDQPQIIEARSEADARRKMVRNGWGRKHFECLGEANTAAEAELIHDEHWPPSDEEE